MCHPHAICAQDSPSPSRERVGVRVRSMRLACSSVAKCRIPANSGSMAGSAIDTAVASKAQNQDRVHMGV